MGKYQIFEMDHNGTRTLHYHLDLENADKLAKVYGERTKEKTYGFQPMYHIDENDVDFSNDIMNDMIQEKIADSDFLDEFLNRKKSVKQALNKMLKEALSNKRYASLDELLKDNDV